MPGAAWLTLPDGFRLGAPVGTALTVLGAGTGACLAGSGQGAQPGLAALALAAMPRKRRFTR